LAIPEKGVSLRNIAKKKAMITSKIYPAIGFTQDNLDSWMIFIAEQC
jgi:hypothetical protein